MRHHSFHIKTLINGIFDILFPETCVVCNTRGSILCDTCQNKLAKTTREIGPALYACLDYQDPSVKNIIWKLKYHRRWNLGDILGKILYESMIETISELKSFSPGQPIYVIPVPLSKKRFKNRGYNQAECIARGFCRSAGSDICQLKTDLIIKIKDTIPQARIDNRKRRLGNIKDAFDVREKSACRGKTIIIIDDVTTTGGTLSEIIELLKKSGAVTVTGFAVAH